MDEVDDHYRATNKNASKPDNRFDHGDRDEARGMKWKVNRELTTSKRTEGLIDQKLLCTSM